MARYVALMGGVSVQVPTPEARDAIAKGAADMLTFPWDSVYVFGMDKLLTQHLDTPLYATTFVLVMNKDRIAAMSPENPKVIEDHCNPESAEKFASGWADVEMAGREKMKADPAHHTLNVPSEADLQKWREAAAPLTAEWKTAAAAKGIDAEEALADFTAALDEAGALMPQR